MNKTELIAIAAEHAGLTKKDTERVLNAALDAITNSLMKGEKVQLSGFGTFETKDREARIGRNPHTKEAIEIPATRVPVFKASKALKDMVEIMKKIPSWLDICKEREEAAKKNIFKLADEEDDQLIAAIASFKKQ